MMNPPKRMACLDEYAADHDLSVLPSLYTIRRNDIDAYRLHWLAGRHNEFSNGEKIYLKVFTPKTTLT